MIKTLDMRPEHLKYGNIYRSLSTLIECCSSCKSLVIPLKTGRIHYSFIECSRRWFNKSKPLVKSC